MKEQNKATPARPEGEGSTEMLSRMNEEHKPLRDWAFQFINWKPSMRILDVGCGGGAAIAEMLQLSEGSTIDGVDYSADSVKCAEQYNSSDLNNRVFIYEGDVMELPFEEQTYDLATAVETIYFWPDLHKSLKEIHRILKPKGLAAILCEIDSPDKAAVWGDIHCELKVYYPEQLAGALEEAGFQDTFFHVREDGYTVVFGSKGS